MQNARMGIKFIVMGALLCEEWARVMEDECDSRRILFGPPAAAASYGPENASEKEKTSERQWAAPNYYTVDAQ